jgi:endoglucanase
MSNLKIIILILFCTIYCNLTVNASTNPSIIGKWCGLKDGSPVTLIFRNDQTMTIKTEAFSSLSFTCKYKVDYSLSPITIDLTDIPSGMACSAIVKFSSSKDLEFFGYFGPPGQTQRPTSIDTHTKRPDGMYLKLSRDSNITVSNATKIIPPKDAKVAFERNKRLGAGICLNGLLDNNSGDKPIKPEYIKMIAEAGFKSVRLPVTWSVHASKTSPYTIEPSFFSRVDSIVNECLKNKLAVSIDIHYYPYINMGNGDVISFEDNIKRFYSLWEQIGEHYKNYPKEVYFDLLNEPNMEMGSELWNELITNTLKIVRKSNPSRTILIGTPNLGQSWTIGLLDLPKNDWNLIVQIHYYLPHLFTHQGLAYAGAASSRGMKWNETPEEKKLIKSDLGYCSKWSKIHSRPINMGEFGVNEYADTVSRARYISFVREVAEKNGFSFHIWGFREVFRVFDEEAGNWNLSVLEALIPSKNK